MTIIKSIKQIKTEQFQDKRILAIDFGTKKLGIAVSDETGTIGTPLLNYPRVNIDSDIEKIKTLLIAYNIDTLIFGLPKDSSGKLEKSQQKIKSFVNIVNTQIHAINIFFWDERYSTQAAKRIMDNKEFKNTEDDKIAAAIFLQALLDFKNK